MTCILMFIYKSGPLDIISAWNKSLVGKKKTGFYVKENIQVSVFHEG